ncbi:membrane anchoring protein efr3a [Mortierella polycephala]|uniref:Membrane anchoring protein efr3a n=1 Tax=Mortierella polycephala TaxID=41804 RepID=A0A9P6Q8P8_9FUNG|nr:membrane anchoring protein efr3a [Mortierella polycephala]
MTFPSAPSIRSRAASISANSAHGVILDPHLYASTTPPLPPPSSVHHANATHSSLIPTRYVKHASLINNCYPVKPEERGPKSSELSYLIFYTTSKPAKLTKVGSFIERRVARDYRKKRLSDVHCSLEIIRSLILSSGAHINIFSKNVVVILDTLLTDISDFEIVRHCQNVFSCFSAAHDGSTLGIDIEFKTVYDRVVAKFADIATLRGENSNCYRLVGLRALEGVVSSTALYAYDPKAQLSMVLPPLLDCLINSKDGIQVSLEDANETTTASPRHSISTHTAMQLDEFATDDDVTGEGLESLGALFKTPNGANVKLILGLTFTYLDEHCHWWPSSLGVSIIKAILKSILPQFRYMVVNEIIVRIDSVDSTTQDLTQRLQKKTTLISAFEAILNSSLSLIGMPVLEVLNSLLMALTKSLSGSESLSKEGESSQLLVLETLIQDGLVRSIGGLATKIYYTNQVPHIISHIVGKLSFTIRVSPQPSRIEGVPTVEYRKTLLRCLTAVIKASKDHGRQEANIHSTEISSDLLTPCLGLLLDGNLGVRAAFAQALITFLATEDDGQGFDNLTRSAPAASSDLYFRSATHQTLYAYARLPAATPTDMAAIYGILRALFTHFQDDEFMRVTPVLFSLQDWCMQQGSGDSDEGLNMVARKRALATVIVIYFQKAVASYQMSEPLEYLNNIKDSRERESQWTPIYYENQESLTRATGYQWEAPSEPLDPILTHPLAREHLVTLLTTGSDRFRAGADRFGVIYNPESQSSLLTAQSTKDLGLLHLPLAFNAVHLLGHKSERSIDSRIRVSRHLEDWALPKIITQPSPSSSDLSSIGETTELSIDSTQATHEGGSAPGLLTTSASIQSHKTIGVDSLKAALTAAHYTVDTTSDAGSAVAGSESRVPFPSEGAQRIHAHSSLSQNLRAKQQLSGINSSAVSISSNLAGSRPDLADLLNTIQVTVPNNSSHLSLVTPPYH